MTCSHIFQENCLMKAEYSCVFLDCNLCCVVFLTSSSDFLPQMVLISPTDLKTTKCQRCNYLIVLIYLQVTISVRKVLKSVYTINKKKDNTYLDLK